MSNCAADKCIDGHNVAMFLCAGPCQRAFHGKCVDIRNGPTVDRICDPDSGVVYFCPACRKVSIPVLCAKVKNIHEQFNAFHKIVNTLYTGFDELHVLFSSLPQLVETKSQSSQTANIIVSPKPHETHNLDSDLELSPDAQEVIISTNKRKKKHSNPDPKRYNTRSYAVKSGNSVGSTPVASIASVSTSATSPPTDNIALQSSMIVDDNPAPLLHNSVSLKVVPVRHSIFISRFDSDTLPETIINYIQAQNIPIQNLSCRKISKSSKPVASFILYAPQESSKTLLDPSIWPAGALVKSFVPRNSSSLKGRDSAHTNIPKNSAYMQQQKN